MVQYSFECIIFTAFNFKNLIAMAITTIGFQNGPNVPGISKIFVTKADNISSLTIGEDYYLTGITMLTDKKFYEIRPEIDTISVENTVKITRTKVITKKISFDLGRNNNDQYTFLNTLWEVAPWGLAFIFVDNNGLAWLSGYDTVNKHFRAYKSLEAAYKSGEKISETGNNRIFTFECETTELDYIFDGDLTGQITGGTATFIEYA